MRRSWWLFACLFLASCGKAPEHPLFPATGQLLVNGQPAKGARVVFHHVGDWGEKSIVPQAYTGEDGRFVLGTFQPKDGAPAGDFRVVVDWPSYRIGKKVGPDRLQKKFSDPATSGLKAHLEERANDVTVNVEIGPADLLPENHGLEPGGRRGDR